MSCYNLVIRIINFRIEAEEAMEEERRRRTLARKDKKSETLKLEKERTIQDSRVIANTTASLRDRLRLLFFFVIWLLKGLSRVDFCRFNCV